MQQFARIIVRPVLLTDYAPEFVDDAGHPVTVWVWVNPPRALIEQYDALRARSKAINQALEAELDAEHRAPLLDDLSAVGKERVALLARLWSQHADPATHWTEEDVLALVAHETEPRLFSWLVEATLERIVAHRMGEQKK